MRCGERLDDYVDGLLSQDDSDDVERHLADCPSCRTEVEGLRALLAKTKALPAGIAPERDLWSGIEGQLADPRTTAKPRRVWPSALVLAASLTLVLGALLTQLPQPAPEEAQQVSALEAQVEAAEGEYEKARQDLALVLAEDAQELDPEIRMVIDENLAIIDGAVDEIRGALAERPSDPRLIRMLMATHQQGLELMRLAAQLANET